MMIAKQGILIIHAIALTTLLIMTMGWQVQIHEKSPQTGFIGSVKPGFFTRIALSLNL
jgi:hypothetical protein